jgi:hypothetical protein
MLPNHSRTEIGRYYRVPRTTVASSRSEDRMSNYADEANTEDQDTAAEEEFAPAGYPTPGSDPAPGSTADSANPDDRPAGDVTEEGMETPMAPSGG